ncbi:MAG TPA: ZIP family metal transporter [Kineosporiaceae bacterium]|nr:ZIP family metal transporter [Kineosporiaceae bacterium]
MSLPQTLLLGLLAGGTILLGLPLGRLRSPAVGMRVFLNAAAVGVLLFLVWDVLSAAWEPIDAGLAAVHERTGGLGGVLGYGALFAGGIAVGLLGLVGYERWMTARAATFRRASAATYGPGAMAADEVAARRGGIAGWSPARQLALLIAIGIGLHNFAEGLAIGQSAASGELALATVLVIGFGLHNATEGFGIVAPLAADTDADRPSWALLGLLGLIGGGPTVVGSVLGHQFVSEPLSVAFLSLAAGSILYVILMLVPVAAKSRRPEMLALGVLVGLLAGFATDAIVTLAGV